jgi:hypothetical protein
LPSKVAAAIEVRIHCQTPQGKEMRLAVQFDAERVVRLELKLLRGVHERPCVGFE